MLGIHPDSKEKGGISTVVDIYRSAGLFERWPIRYVGTMASGSQVGKLRIAMVALLSFVRLLVGGRVALVHAHTASRASFWRKSMFMLLARAARKPVVLHLHGAEFERFYRDECGPLRRAFIRNVLNGAERVVVLSLQWQRAIERIAPRAHVCTIVNPIDLPARARTAAERAANVVLFLGRFGPRKGIYDLLQAIEIVRQRVPDVKLRCGGDGDVEGVRARVSARGLESNVEVLGWVAGQAKEKELERAAVYVLPSYAEGLPMGVLEAMAAGTSSGDDECGRYSRGRRRWCEWLRDSARRHRGVGRSHRSFARRRGTARSLWRRGTAEGRGRLLHGARHRADRSALCGARRATEAYGEYRCARRCGRCRSRAELGVIVVPRWSK